MFSDYIKQFINETKLICDQINLDDIEKLTLLLKKVGDQKGKLFILGLGGSAGNASHACNDFRKIIGIETYAPTDNVSELTAWTNDKGFEYIFAEYLRVSHLGPKDMVLIFSVGGGSEHTSRNLVLALDYAAKVGASTGAIVSRDGGYSKQKADATVLVPVVSEKRITPHAEGWQGVLWHLIVTAIRDQGDF